jgi:hypothetical protein
MWRALLVGLSVVFMGPHHLERCLWAELER